MLQQIERLEAWIVRLVRKKYEISRLEAVVKANCADLSLERKATEREIKGNVLKYNEAEKKLAKVCEEIHKEAKVKKNDVCQTSAYETCQ